MRKKRTIFKRDKGKMFRMYNGEGDCTYIVVRKVYDNRQYIQYFYSEDGWVKSDFKITCGRTNQGDRHYYEEINALTAIVIFGKNIPKEFFRR